MCLDLENGRVQGDGFTFTEEEKANLPLVTAEIREVASKKETGRSIAFAKINSSEWFRFYSKLKLYGVNTTQNKLIANIDITRWPHLNRPEAIMQSLLKVRPKTSWREKTKYTSHQPYAGCLNQSPLRYGDIESDGEKEIVLYLNGELVVFSPAYERIVFASFIQADDWFNDPTWKGKISPSELDGKTYQYQSAQMLYNGISTPAYLHYGKLFTGDIDSDGNPDIIVWSKTYVSNEDSKDKGFKLVKNDLKHYERDLTTQKRLENGVTGEYLPQITTDIVIESWLRDKELSWQKGYPSESECEGMGGKLIPEMHAPLLNDPDVLQ